MIGIIYKTGTREIIMIIENVQSVTDTDIIGKDASAKGIDFAQASFCIVESTELQVKDTLGTFTDTRHLLPRTAEQKKIDELTTEKEQMNLSIIELWENIIPLLP